MAAPGERPVKAFAFRLLQKPEELRAVEEVQRIAWGLTDEPPVPSPVQRAMQDNGGLVLGAFAEDMKAAKYTYTVWLLDKSGRMSQNSDNPIVSSQFDRPPAFLGVAHDRLVVSVENKVEVYR